MSGDPVVVKAAQEAVDQVRHQRLGQPAGLGEKDAPRRAGAGHRRVRRRRGRDRASSAGTPPTRRSIGHLFGPGDLILHDALSHNSIVQGCILSGARRRPFPHNDWQAADRILGAISATSIAAC